jgi:transcriptional regulator with PAS, ATPase and Fis domain
VTILSIHLWRAEGAPHDHGSTIAEIYQSGLLAKAMSELGAEEWLFVPGEQFTQLFAITDRSELMSRAFGQLASKLELANVSSLEQMEMARNEQAVQRFLQTAVGWLPNGEIDLGHAEQFRQAYALALERGFCGIQFNRLFQRGVWLQERLRLETQLYHLATDRKDALVELIGKIFGREQSRSISIIGASPEAQTFSQRLDAEGFCNVTSGAAHAFPSEASFDVVVLFDTPSIGNLNRSNLQKIMEARNNAPLLVVDMRREVAASETLKLYNLYLYNGADLERMASQNREALKSITAQAKPWFDDEVRQFMLWRASEERFHYGSMVGRSPQMLHVFELIARIAQNDITVLIDGESGTGKELVARAIHDASRRSRRPFMVVNCGALPENLLESELFGHVRGAFTGAVNNKRGLFEEANGGTVFLDEVGETSPALQVKLLRFLQDGEVKRVGSNEVLHLSVRVLAATNRSLKKMVAEGAFRSDLYYRLNVIQINLPALRERAEDIPLLSMHFLKKTAARMRKPAREISPEALLLLSSYAWPGNVRELENVIERAAALSVGTVIAPADLPSQIQETAAAEPSTNGRQTIKEVERRHILETLDALDWDYDEACRALGIGRTTLWRKLKEYKLPENE